MATSQNTAAKVAHKLGKAPRMWAVASGKGGVGKTFITSSLAITLSKLGHNVAVIDLDVTGANIHTAFGVRPSKVGLWDFFRNGKTMVDCMTATSLVNVSFIQGFWDSWAPVELNRSMITHLIEEARTMAVDYILFDLGSGTHEAHLEVFKHADERILVTTPEPTSIEKTYRFLEAFLCDGLKSDSDQQVYEKLIENLRHYRHAGLTQTFSFVDFFNSNEGMNRKAFNDLQERPIHLLLNCCRSQTNSTLGYSIKSVCNKYYDLRLDYLGGLDYDNAVWQSIRNREAVLIAQPFTSLAGQFLSICKQLIDPEELRAVV